MFLVVDPLGKTTTDLHAREVPVHGSASGGLISTAEGVETKHRLHID